MKKPKIGKGQPFQAIIRKGIHSRTLGGIEAAGRKAFDGKIFMVKEATNTHIETEDNFFSFDEFEIVKI